MSEINSVPNLEMIPTHDLIAEVMKRCSPAVFIGTRYEGEGREQEFKNFSHWKGNLETCRGMCHEMDSFLQRQMIREEIGGDDDANES